MSDAGSGNLRYGTNGLHEEMDTRRKRNETRGDEKR